MEEKHVGEIGGMELGIAAGFAGAIVTVVISIATLAYWMGGKFAEIDARFGGIERGMRALASASSESHRAVMALKGLIEKGEAEYLGKRVESAFKLYVTNPLTKEELKFLKEFVSKVARNADEVTIEEAEKAYELGSKLFIEDFEVKGFLAAMVATYARGYLVSKEVKKRAERRPGGGRRGPERAREGGNKEDRGLKGNDCLEEVGRHKEGCWRGSGADLPPRLAAPLKRRAFYTSTTPLSTP